MAKPPKEIIFEDDEDDAESTVSDEPSNEEFETSDEDDEFEVDEPRTQALRKTVISRRGLLVAALLAGAGAVATGAVLLRERGPAGTELMNEYEKIGDPTARQMYVIKQVAAGNVPSSSKHFVTIKVNGKSGTTLQFEVVPHGLRIGHDGDYIEAPTDGPYSMAACEAQGLTLSNRWMSGKIRDQAFTTGGKVPFIAYAEISRLLGVPYNGGPPDGVKMKSPEYVRARNLLLGRWRSEHKFDDDRLASGYFKEVIQDSVRIGQGKVATFPGYSEVLINGSHELAADVHEKTYFDYSHLGRCVKWEMKVDEKTITMGEFFGSKDYQKEFGFDASASKTTLRPYKYSLDLLKFMDENGYLRSEYDSAKEKEEREKNKKKEEDKKKKEEDKKKKEEEKAKKK